MTTFPQVKGFEREVAGKTIDLPLRDKVYAFPVAISIELGLKFTVMREEAHRLKAAADEGTEYTVKDEARELIDDGDSIHDVYFRLIGDDKLAELKADGVSWPELVHIGETLFMYHTAGPQAALLVWQLFEAAGDDARPPVRKPASRSGSSRQKTSQTSSSKKTPAATKRPRSVGATSSKRGS